MIPKRNFGRARDHALRHTGRDLDAAGRFAPASVSRADTGRSTARSTSRTSLVAGFDRCRPSGSRWNPSHRPARRSPLRTRMDKRSHTRCRWCRKRRQSRHRVAGPLRHRIVRVSLGEMTVVASRVLTAALAVGRIESGCMPPPRWAGRGRTAPSCRGRRLARCTRPGSRVADSPGAPAWRRAPSRSRSGPTNSTPSMHSEPEHLVHRERVAKLRAIRDVEHAEKHPVRRVHHRGDCAHPVHHPHWLAGDVAAPEGEVGLAAQDRSINLP